MQTGKYYTGRKLVDSKSSILWKNMGLHFPSFVNHNETFPNYSYLEKCG